MHTFVAQDYVTIRGPGNGTITQGQNGWLELPEYPDAVAWLDVREVTTGSGTITMGYQTAPTANDSSFTAITGPLTGNTVPFTVATGVTVTPLLKDLLTVPLAHWFRWQLSASGTSGTWDVTFRLFLAANCLSRRHKHTRRG
jgi:hypothetical protein